MKKQPGYDKLRGGYYTPKEIVEFIVNWIITDENMTVLEPSCGSGGFLSCVVNKMVNMGGVQSAVKKQVVGVEIDKKEARKARNTGATVSGMDFFKYYAKSIKNRRYFDAVVGNPPFIRYQDFDDSSRELAFSLLKELELHPNKLTNIWIPFLVLSCECLSQNGRLGMVIPAELFQVNYAAEIREYLSEKIDRLTIVTFKELLFSDAQQEVVLLLGEKRSPTKGIDIIEMQGTSDLKNYIHRNINDRTEVKQLDHTRDKWTKYYLTNDELSILHQLQADSRISKADKVLEVNVGVVSGQNDFFIIDKKTVQSRKLDKYVIPIVGKAEQLSGLVFTEEDYETLSNKQRKIHFFVPRDLSKSKLSNPEKAYINYGEKEKFHEGYKCKIRKRWYTVPQSWKPEAFFLRQVHKYPRIVINKTEATVTDTLHKIKFTGVEKSEKVAGAFLNSFTFALSEITGRSYGGGVLTFEPSEVRQLKIPLQGMERLDTSKIDVLIRGNDMYGVLNYVDEILLHDELGYSWEDINMLRSIWEKLSKRRINRRKPVD